MMADHVAIIDRVPPAYGFDRLYVVCSAISCGGGSSGDNNGGD